MSKPRYIYEIEKNEFILRAEDGKSAVLQQADVLGREGEKDSLIFIDRKNAEAIRDALDDWLKDTAS